MEGRRMLWLSFYDQIQINEEQEGLIYISKFLMLRSETFS